MARVWAKRTNPALPFTETYLYYLPCCDLGDKYGNWNAWSDYEIAFGLKRLSLKDEFGPHHGAYASARSKIVRRETFDGSKSRDIVVVVASITIKLKLIGT